MDTLTFECPRTASEVQTGIGMDVNTLVLTRGIQIYMRCPHCKDEHLFVVRDGRLSDPV
jgi:hypothetical protein